jgi:two-component system sensor histidine kinase BaeS
VSLRMRILLLLAGVVIGAALASVAAVRFVAERRFRTFVSSGDTARAEELALLLAAFHDLRGSWDGVQDLFGDMGPAGRAGMGGMMREGRRGGPLRPGESLLGARSRVVLVDLGGTVVADSSRVLLGTRRLAGDAGTAGGADAAAAGIAVAGRDGVVGTLFVGTMLEPGLAASDAAFLASVTRAIVAATVLAAAAALVAGLFAVRRLTQPVAELTRAAERAGAGDLDVRVAVSGRDEIARLAGSFNRMTEALRDQEAGRRRMIADSAHELRTPVSLIQGTVEAMLDGVYAPDRSTLEGLHEETLRLSRLVEDLNELSLLESGTLALAIEDADLAEIARIEAGRFTARAAERGVTIAVECAPRLPRVSVDRLRIGQVIANLLGNALRHTPRGGAIAVRLEAPDGGRLRLAVEDSGPGIPEGERARVFERYYRVDGARAAAEGGRGLGLAIAAGIVKAHGGTMYAGRSAVLGGAMVAMEMPAARLDAAAPVPL